MPRRLRVSRLQALTMTAASGAYSLAGFSANLSRAQHLTMTANTGIYQWAGQNATLQKQKFLLTATRGLYTYTGQSAIFTYTPAATGPSWIAANPIPTVAFTKGSAHSPFSLSPYLTGYDPALWQIGVINGSLETGISIDSVAPALTYDDTVSVVGTSSGQLQISSKNTVLPALPYTPDSVFADVSPNPSFGNYVPSTVVTWGGVVRLSQVADPVGSGISVYLHRILKSDAAVVGGNSTVICRAERMFNHAPASYIFPGQEQWFCFAIRAVPGETPTTGINDGNSRHLVWQNHTQGNGATQPPLALIHDHGAGTRFWRRSWNTKPDNTWISNGGTNPDFEGNIDTVIGPYPTAGIWYKYIVHMRSGYTTAQAPKTEVWEAVGDNNYTKVISAIATTDFNDYNTVSQTIPNGGTYNRIGLYKWTPTHWDDGVTLTSSIAIDATEVYQLTNTGTTNYFNAGVATLASLVPSAVADFAARSSGAYFAENFSTYANSTAWYNFWNRGALVGVWTPKNPGMGSTWTNAWDIITDPTHVKSGKALRAYMGKNPSSGGTLDSQYCIFPLSGDPLNISGSYHLKYYFQAVIWIDDLINYYWAIPGGGSRGVKLFVNETWYSQSFGDAAECVIDSNMTYPGFITGYHTDGGGGTHPLSRTWERGQAIPSNNSSFAGQGGIDNGTALDTTDASYYRRYGPMYQMPPTPNQASLMSAQGVPNANAAIGGVAWNRGGFTVIEIECDAIAHRCRVWAAPYGSAPKMTHDSGVGNAFNISLDDTGGRLGGGGPPLSAGTGNGFSGIGPTNLIFTADEASNPGRPAAPYVDYVEIIAHPNPINFPGGFRPPGT